MIPGTFHQKADQTNEYLLVIYPDSDINNKIQAEKEHLNKEAFSIHPLITVANFFARETMEETIIRWVQRICNLQEAFNVTFNNYSGCPPHTIYLRVQNEMPFKRLAKELVVVKNYISSCSCPVMEMPAPRLDIANILSADVYFKALSHYAHRSFHESFTVNELLLLRKDLLGNCRPVNVFGLMPASTLCN